MKGTNLEASPTMTRGARAGDAVAASERPVLVAIDFSQEAEAALIWACDYAERIGAPLEVLHVVHDPADAPGTYKPDSDDPLEPIVEVARRRLADFLERIGDENPHRPALETASFSCTPGLPASTIVQVAQAHGAQHLVLGGPQRGALGRLLHGSTAQKVAGLAHLPVTIVKAEA